MKMSGNFFGSISRRRVSEDTPATARRRWLASAALLLAVIGIGVGVALWKRAAVQRASAAAASQPEPMESVTVAVAKEREHRRATTSVGTILALRSITLRNELPGTVQKVALTPGQIVEEGTLLVALDVSVEEAELKAQEAETALAETLLKRMQNLLETRAVPEHDVDRARAERDVALAQIARMKAVIARKTIRAPFRARVGIADVHPGQFLEEGTLLTTLQGVDEAVHVDFTVPQRVAAGLHVGETVEVVVSPPVAARIIAMDARIDPLTRNALVRARIEGATNVPAPGASVRVRTPVGPPEKAVAIPVSALRKGPGGDHVFVVGPDKNGKTRAHLRAVQSGAMLGDEVLILAGLSVGEQVAATGSFKLRDSALVAVASATVNGAASADGAAREHGSIPHGHQ
jgi:membrane fusion protein (multidrug efflux system)